MTEVQLWQLSYSCMPRCLAMLLIPVNWLFLWHWFLIMLLWYFFLSWFKISISAMVFSINTVNIGTSISEILVILALISADIIRLISYRIPQNPMRYRRYVWEKAVIWNQFLFSLHQTNSYSSHSLSLYFVFLNKVEVVKAIIHDIYTWY